MSKGLLHNLDQGPVTFGNSNAPAKHRLECLLKGLFFVAILACIFANSYFDKKLFDFSNILYIAIFFPIIAFFIFIGVFLPPPDHKLTVDSTGIHEIGGSPSHAFSWDEIAGVRTIAHQDLPNQQPVNYLMIVRVEKNSNYVLSDIATDSSNKLYGRNVITDFSNLILYDFDDRIDDIKNVIMAGMRKWGRQAGASTDAAPSPPEQKPGLIKILIKPMLWTGAALASLGMSSCGVSVIRSAYAMRMHSEPALKLYKELGMIGILMALAIFLFYFVSTGLIDAI